MMAYSWVMCCVFYGSLQSIHLYIFVVAVAGTDGMDGMDGGKSAGEVRVLFGAAVAARDDRGDSAVSRERADAWGAGCSRGMCRVSCTGGLPGSGWGRFAGMFVVSVVHGSCGLGGTMGSPSHSHSQKP